jgi:hypothetical protein
MSVSSGTTGSASPVPTPQSSTAEDTPTRASRTSPPSPATVTARPRRASSLPPPTLRIDKSADSSRATSPAQGENVENRRSVKHLTCSFWKKNGRCRYSEAQCLYAHHDVSPSSTINNSTNTLQTGRYAEAPRTLVPGEPAKAGRSLENALRELGLDPNKSSSSLTSTRSGTTTPGLEMPLSNRPSSNTNVQSASAHLQAIQAAPGNVHIGPIPVTTLNASAFPAGIPNNPAMAMNENLWLHRMLDAAAYEKALLFNTIDTLNADKVALRAEKDAVATEVDRVKAEKDQVTQERDILRATVTALQAQAQQHQRVSSGQFSGLGSGINGNAALGGGMLLPGHRSSSGSRSSWGGLTTNGLGGGSRPTSRPSSAHSERDGGDYGVVRGLGPGF